MNVKDLTADGTWFAVLEHGGDNKTYAVHVCIVNDKADCAARVEHFYDLSAADESILECFDPQTLGIQCAIALDAFAQRLIDNGISRENAVAARNNVVLAENLSGGGWPAWDYMTDEQRHLAVCASLDIADPWA
jgi:hypothetical protein